MSVVYLDTSALVKLAVVEAESSALQNWLSGVEEVTTFATSALTRVELTRAARRHGPAAVESAERVLTGLHVVALLPEILADAAVLDPPALRTLDALHLATARRIGTSLSGFVAYDHRLVDAAAAASLPVLSPA